MGDFLSAIVIVAAIAIGSLVKGYSWGTDFAYHDTYTAQCAVACAPLEAAVQWDAKDSPKNKCGCVAPSPEHKP